MTEIAIKVDNVFKDFILPHEKTGSVKGVFTSMFREATKTKEPQHALRGISFEVEKGEFFGIVGRNGSGKSTMLKMLAGIYQPTKGKISTHGKLVSFIELGVGFNAELSGRDNVYLNGAMLGFSSKEVDNMYHEIVKFAELEKFMDQKLKNFSSGMQVRLAFSMAIRADADIMLIDEVLAVGDADFQRKCYTYFKKIKKSGQTIVFVSHDMGAVQQYCDRALLIEKGKIVKMGDADMVATAYSKLFMTDSKTSVINKKSKASPSGEERWGDDQARWQRVTVKFEAISKTNPEPKFITITAKGKARQDIDYPIFGFSIKDSEFKHLIGTSTVRRHVKPAPLKKGQVFSVSWQVPNIFNTGTFYVDSTLAHDKADMVSDRWPDATVFEISRLEDNPYPMYGDINCVVKVDED